MSDERHDDKTELSRPPQFRRTPMADGAKEIPSSAKAPPPAWSKGAFPGAAALARPKASASDPQPLAVWPSHETAPVPSVIDDGSAELEPTDVAIEPTALLGVPREDAAEEMERTQPIAVPVPDAVEPPQLKTERLEPMFGAPRVAAKKRAPEPTPPPAPAQRPIEQVIRYVSEAELGVKIALGALAVLAVAVAIFVVYVLTS
jgi:hypothetical protein